MIKLTTNVTIDNPIEGDLEIQAGEFVQLSPVEQAGQAIKNRLQFFKGESFLDVREGVPYFTEILTKGVSLTRVRSIIRQTILNVPGVVDVPQLDLRFDRAARSLTVTFRATYQDGTEIEAEDYAPLIIRLGRDGE